MFFLLQLSFPCSTCHYTWHPLCISFKLSFLCVWPLQILLVGRNVFVFKPVLWSCVYGCAYERIFIHTTRSNFCHIKIKCLFVSLCSWFYIITQVATQQLYPFFLRFSTNAPICLLSTGIALYFSSLIFSSVISWLPTFLQTFCMLCMILLSFWMVHILFSSFPRYFEKSAFSGFHRYKPQSWKSCTADHSRENFFRAPFRTETNMSLFNILSEFCLFHSRTAVFQSWNI